MTPEEINSGVSDLYDAMLEEALIKNAQKQKGFGYDISESRKRNSRSGEDDGVRSEGEQSSEPGEPEGTTRGVAAQVLRHRSFTYQEFSQRYADSSLLGDTIPLPELRRQDTKNRQNSIDDIDPFTKQEFQIKMQQHFAAGMKLYKEMLDASIAKECARFVLPLAVPTKIYMTGSCRSWIHYIDLRSAHGTQKEHMDIAEGARTIFIEQFPTVSEALGWL